MSVHEGHRQRKKEQFREHGLDAFADHEALELLLYYAIPRQDTNPLPPPPPIKGAPPFFSSYGKLPCR